MMSGAALGVVWSESMLQSIGMAPYDVTQANVVEFIDKVIELPEKTYVQGEIVTDTNMMSTIRTCAATFEAATFGVTWILTDARELTHPLFLNQACYVGTSEPDNFDTQLRNDIQRLVGGR